MTSPTNNTAMNLSPTKDEPSKYFVVSRNPGRLVIWFGQIPVEFDRITAIYTLSLLLEFLNEDAQIQDEIKSVDLIESQHA